MEKLSLSKNSKRILSSLANGTYPNSVPENDIEEFNLLMQMDLVRGVYVKDPAIVAPKLTDYGRAYIHQNPKMKNPSIFDDKKYIVTTAISIVALGISIIALLTS